MKNILIIIPNLNIIGGTERAATNIANLLCNHHNVTLLSLTEKNEEPFFFIDSRIKLLYLNVGQSPSHLIKKTKWVFKCKRELQDSIRKHKIDIVIGLTHNVNLLVTMLSKKHLKTIGCEHIDFETIPYLSKILIRVLYPKLTTLVVLSPSVKNTLCFLNSNIVVIPNSLPFQCDEPSKLTDTRILMLGRLSKEKGYERIIPLAKYLKKEFPLWKINIFGEGPIKDDIKQTIIDSNLSNIELSGSTKDVMKEYLCSSIFLSTSHHEAFPMVFLEAMHCGIPIVSYRNQGAEAIIEPQVNGFIVESSDELINITTRLISDKQLRDRIGKHGLRTASAFRTDVIKKQWLGLIDRL